jgi:DNA excision repair protein ERCC-3
MGVIVEFEYRSAVKGGVRPESEHGDYKVARFRIAPGAEALLAYSYAHSCGQLPSDEERQVDEWAKRPYAVIPAPDGSLLLVVPSWIPLAAGWLVNVTESYRIYRVDHYALWAGLVPEELKDVIDSRDVLRIQLTHTHLVGPDEDLEKAWDRYRKHLLRREPGGIRVKEGERWDLLLALVGDGVLPFVPNPVIPRWRWKTAGLELRPYQREALEAFIRTGAVTVTWPPGAGKTTLAVACISAVSGRTLIVVPSVSILRRWEDELKKWLPNGPRPVLLHSGAPPRKPGAEIIISTYQSALKRFVGGDEEFELLVVDEAHHLPADTFSKLASIRTRYRIALTASPFREDGRTELIYALGGFPVAADYEELVRTGYVKKPELEIYVTSYKLQALKALVDKLLRTADGKIIVYSDYIDEGRQLAAFLNQAFAVEVPYIHGDTPLNRRYSELEGRRLVVASRVFDEGMDIPDLAASVEYSFLFGSRRQEFQRAGRLMHSLMRGVRHYVLMTPDEFERYRKRFLPLLGRGIRVSVKDVAELLAAGVEESGTPVWSVAEKDISAPDTAA